MSPTSYLDVLRLTLPEILLTIGALAALSFDLLAMRRSGTGARWRAGAAIACIGCLAAIFLILMHPMQAVLPDGMLVVNSLTQLVQVVLAGFAILTILISVSSSFTSNVGEYIALVLFATAAMMFLVSTQNLLMIFVSLELLSLSLYVLTAFDKSSRISAEAALKYFLFGGMSAAFLLFGISLLYGLSGSINLQGVDLALQARPFSPLLAVAIVMTVIGFGFKVAAAPFHLWAPDAYQGAPTPSAGFIASSSKIASFFVFALVMTTGMAAAEGSGAWHGFSAGWVPVLSLVAAISMIAGNLAALVQTSVRRLLAYSAIGHAGYILLGALSHSAFGVRALLYYVITYGLAAVGAFGVLAALDAHRIDRIKDVAGLSRRAPLLSFCMLIFLLSLAGIPPLSGFFAKFYIFTSVLSGGGFGLLWLVVLAIGMSAVSLFYYLKLLKQIYVIDPPEEADAIQTPWLTGAVVSLAALLVVLLGCFPATLLDWIDAAMRSVPR